jgi:hypothetical protein
MSICCEDRENWTVTLMSRDHGAAKLKEHVD